MSMQYAITRQAPGGINQQAMAAIENALLDVKAKSLGVPVYELFGGKVRDRLPLYWSHCGSYRFRNAAMMGVEPVRSFDDVVKLGKHVKERGFKALKTNIFPLRPQPAQHAPAGLRPHAGRARAQCRRRDAGGDRRRAGRRSARARARHGHPARHQLQLQTEGYIKVARTCEPYNLFWLEIDSYDPEGCG
jgi:L-alanine-DL-glutamate epimerase-like enolase superfamily enzyme